MKLLGAALAVLFVAQGAVAGANQTDSDLNYISIPDLASIGLDMETVSRPIMDVQSERQNPLVRLKAGQDVRRLLTELSEANANVDLKTISGEYRCRTLLSGEFLYQFFNCTIGDDGHGDIAIAKTSGSQNFVAVVSKVGLNKPAIAQIVDANIDGIGERGVVYSNGKKLFLVIREDVTNRIVELIRR